MIIQKRESKEEKMKLTRIEHDLKGIILGFALCGLLVYVWVLPMFGHSLAESYPEFAGWYTPWLLFLRITVIPCYLTLIDAWKVAGKIGEGKAFSYDNGRCFKRIAGYAGGDALFFFAGNILLWLWNKNHPGIVIASLLFVFVGLAIAVASKALAQLVDNAAKLQEESEWTI